MRKNYIMNTQDEIKDKMLLFEASLLKASNKIMELNYNVSKFDVINFYIDEDKEITVFENIQKNEIMKVAQQINERDQKVSKLISDACDKSYKAFLNENRIEVHDDNDDSNNNKGHLIGDNSNRKMKFTQKAAESTHFKKLIKYIKLHDILITRCNLNLAIDILRKMKESLSFTKEKMDMIKSKKKFGRKLVK